MNDNWFAKNQATDISADGISTEPPCPDCGGLMVKRTNRWGGEFFGCVEYPKCIGTKDVRVWEAEQKIKEEEKK